MNPILIKILFVFVAYGNPILPQLGKIVDCKNLQTCDVDCRNIAQCVETKIVTNASRTLLTCDSEGSCTRASLNGIPNGDSISVECLNKVSCIELKVSVIGTYMNGVRILSTSSNAFSKGEFNCDIDGICTLECVDGINLFPCKEARYLCDFANTPEQCQCIGGGCIDVVPIATFSPIIPGLSCFPGTDDNPPDACTTVNGTTTLSVVNGGVICSENFDCCPCKGISCIQCTEVVCNGDSSCIGQNMTIIGNENGSPLICDGDHSCELTSVFTQKMSGISCNGDVSCNFIDLSGSCQTSGCIINCNGDDSCKNSEINLSSVSGLLCSGDISCAFSNINIDCIKGFGCRLQCVGDESCKESTLNAQTASSIECVGDEACFKSLINAKCKSNYGCGINCLGEQSCFNSTFNVENSRGLSCAGPGGCSKSTFNLPSNIAGGISCGGGVTALNALLGSCNEATIVANNVDSLLCKGSQACFKSLINITSKTSDFSITCGAIAACAKAEINVSITSPISGKLIHCGASEACANTTINISGQIAIEKLVCGGADSCDGLTINLSHGATIGLIDGCNLLNGVTRNCEKCVINGISGPQPCLS